MRSSTFNSSRDVPNGRWGYGWFLAIGMTVMLLGAGELGARKHGAQPQLRDGAPLWSVAREQARTSRGAPDPLVLAGSSRFQLGIDPRILSEVIARPVSNLSIAASLPFPVLQDLANDSEFNGFVLYDVGAFRQDEDDFTSPGFALPEAYVSYFHSRTAISAVEIRTHEFLQSRLAILEPQFSPHTRLMRLGVPVGALPQVSMSRYMPTDFRGAPDIEATRRYWAKRFEEDLNAVSADELMRFTGKLSRLVERIQRRGGNVIFFRMVSSFGVREVEDRVSPRAQWDWFASHVAGIAIHYDDVSSLRNFRAMDGSHLDASDVPAFTRALGRTLVDRDVFRPAHAATHTP